MYSFKAPSDEELDHDYLWRNFKALPERGRIGIFNRSYYEEVLVVRVHPEILERQRIPPELKHKSIWKHRYEEINNFEKYLHAQRHRGREILPATCRKTSKRSASWSGSTDAGEELEVLHV